MSQEKHTEDGVDKAVEMLDGLLEGACNWAVDFMNQRREKKEMEKEISDEYNQEDQ